MKYYRNIRLKEHVTIGDMLFIFNASNYAIKQFKELQNKIFHLNIKKTIKKICILFRILKAQIEIIQRLTYKKFFAVVYLKKIEAILVHIGSITKEIKGKKDFNYEGVVLDLCGKLAVHQHSFPIDVAKKVTFKEAEILLKNILLEKIEMIHVLLMSNHSPKQAIKYINKLRSHVNRIGQKNEIIQKQKNVKTTRSLGVVFANANR